MSSNTAKVGWELSLPGVKTYPLRMAFILVGMPSIVWVSLYAVFPAVVLALVPIIGQVIYGDIRPAASVFLIVCGCLAVGTVLMARSYARMGYEIDREAGTLRVVPPAELRSDIQESSLATSEDLGINLEEISRIEFVTLPGYVVARVRYPGSLPQNPYAFIVPTHRYSEVESVVQSADIPISSDVGLSFFERLRARWQWFAVLIVSTGVLVVAPLVTLVAIAL
jgi:hypothetical protein